MQWYLEKRRLRFYFYRLTLPCSCHFIVFFGHHDILFWCLNVFIGDYHLFLWNLSLLALALCLISNLFYVLCFEISYEILAFTSWFRFKTHLKSALAHSRLSSWIDTWNEVCGGSFGSHYLCSICCLPLFFVVVSIIFPISTWKSKALPEKIWFGVDSCPLGVSADSCPTGAPWLRK